jgi:hypothetical protein
LKKSNVEYQEALKYLGKWQNITTDNELKALFAVQIDGTTETNSKLSGFFLFRLYSIVFFGLKIAGESVKAFYDRYVDAYNNDVSWCVLWKQHKFSYFLKTPFFLSLSL